MDKEDLNDKSIKGLLIEMVSLLSKLTEEGSGESPGYVKVYNFKVVNSEKVYHLHGPAKYLVIHNAGSSDISISFPNSAGQYYTIPSGNNSANPLIIPMIKRGLVDQLHIHSNGVESLVEVVAILWDY